MRKKLVSLSLAGVILIGGAPAVLAQDASGEGTTSTDQNNDDGFPWGLLGLAGLAGLLGMNRDKGRRDDRDRTTGDTTRRNP